MLNNLLSIGTQNTNYSAVSSKEGLLISHFKNVLSQPSFTPHRLQKEYTDNNIDAHRYKYGTVDPSAHTDKCYKEIPHKRQHKEAFLRLCMTKASVRICTP